MLLVKEAVAFEKNCKESKHEPKCQSAKQKVVISNYGMSFVPGAQICQNFLKFRKKKQSENLVSSTNLKKSKLLILSIFFLKTMKLMLHKPYKISANVEE